MARILVFKDTVQHLCKTNLILDSGIKEKQRTLEGKVNERDRKRRQRQNERNMGNISGS